MIIDIKYFIKPMKTPGDKDGGGGIYDLVDETFHFTTFFISPPRTLNKY
jgi:hypothetical protein